MVLILAPPLEISPRVEHYRRWRTSYRFQPQRMGWWAINMMVYVFVYCCGLKRRYRSEKRWCKRSESKSNSEYVAGLKTCQREHGRGKHRNAIKPKKILSKFFLNAIKFLGDRKDGDKLNLQSEANICGEVKKTRKHTKAINYSHATARTKWNVHLTNSFFSLSRTGVGSLQFSMVSYRDRLGHMERAGWRWMGQGSTVECPMLVGTRQHWRK